MFNLLRQRRDERNQGECTSPPPGTDSTFGVRSLNGSVSWSPGARGARSPEREDDEAQMGHSSRESDTDASGGGSSDGVNLIATEEGATGLSDTDHTSTGDHHFLRGQEGDARDAEDVDATPLPTTSGLPPLPDPFAPSPPPSPSSPPTHSTSPPLLSSPIPVSGRIAHVGQGIIWPPSSPDETLHPLSLSTSQGLASLVHPRPLPSLNLDPDSPNMYDDHIHRALSDLERMGDMGGISGRSSPASFTSLPSYVGSMSSLSRASSPVSGISGAPISRETSYSAHHRFAGLEHEREYAVEEPPGSRSEELVLPTLSLPSSSLHLSLPKWEGEASGVKVVLLGDVDTAQSVIRELEGKVELVEVGDGVGIVREGKVVLVLCISPRAELVKRRVLSSYALLSRLLHPHPPLGSEVQIRAMIAEHAKRSLWTHAVFNMPDDIDQTLSKLVPVISLKSGISRDHTPVSDPDAVSPVLSPVDDPTPMPGAQSATSYFATEPTQSTPTLRIATDLVDLLTKLPEIEAQSIDAFLAHRARITETVTSSLEASITSADSSNPFSPHSAHSGASSDPAPMPTVARASGVLDWEAGFSRRLAEHLQRKEKSDRSGRPGRAKGVRRTRRRACTPPLFPLASGHRVSGSVWRSIWARLFAPWIPPAIMDKPGVVELPAPEDEVAQPVPVDKARAKRSLSAWRWGLGAVVFVGVGLLLSKATITADIYIGTGACC